MTDEQTNTTDTKGKEPDKPVEKPDKPLSIVDEAKAIRDEIVKARDELKEENDRKAKLQSEEMRGGTGGGHIKDEPKKEETPKEYNDRIEEEISEGKHDD